MDAEDEMTKEMTDAQMLRKLKREIKIVTRRHIDTMEQRDILIDALQDMIKAFCPGEDWAGVPIRQKADAAIVKALDNEKCIQHF